MMGKEPVVSIYSVYRFCNFSFLMLKVHSLIIVFIFQTLAKVIAAVLRFNDVQTQQVIRREEARHNTVS